MKTLRELDRIQELEDLEMDTYSRMRAADADAMVARDRASELTRDLLAVRQKLAAAKVAPERDWDQEWSEFCEYRFGELLSTTEGSDDLFIKVENKDRTPNDGQVVSVRTGRLHYWKKVPELRPLTWDVINTDSLTEDV